MAVVAAALGIVTHVTGIFHRTELALVIVVDHLVEAEAKHVAPDIQFTNPTDNTDDEDLGDTGAIWMAGAACGPRAKYECP